MTATFANIALSAICASKTNPRKTFNQVGLEELSSSIREMGVAQPILVRPHPEPDDFIKYEIVAGERRYRASIMANATTIPCLIRDLTDRQALELQVIENLQREDVHPLEEAEGYDQLMKMHSVTADQLVDKVGKSRSYVYGRLKLLDLEPDARLAFYDSKLNPSTALLIARIPKVLQEKALKEITEPKINGGEPLSFRDAKDHLQRRYMLQLALAPFDTAIDALVANTGSCAQCPKRTGNQPELFVDIESADVCTDPDCFESKKVAYITFQINHAAETGQQVIEGDKALEIKPDTWSDFEGAGYAALDENCMDDAEERTYREILGDACPTPILFKDPHEDEVALIEIVKLSDIEHILKEKGVVAEVDPSPQNGKATEASRKAEIGAQKKLDEEVKVERKKREALFHAVRDKLDGELTLDIRRILAKRIAQSRWLPSNLCKLYGWDEDISSHQNRDKKLLPAIDKLDEKKLNMLLIDLLMVSDLNNIHSYNFKQKPQELHEAAAAAGINPLTLKTGSSAKAKPAPTTKTSDSDRATWPWPFPSTKKQDDKAVEKKPAKKGVAKPVKKPAVKKPSTKPAAKKAVPTKKPVKVAAKKKVKIARKK